MLPGTATWWDTVLIASIGVPAAIRPITGNSAASTATANSAAPAAAAATGQDARREAFDPLGHPDDLDRAGAMGEPPDEAAFLERRDQPVNARFGTQVEGILHLFEGGRHAVAFHPLVDEFQQIALFLGQHGRPPIARFC
jgi:hypothetical protein